MSNPTRICLVGLPRSGSQYVAELIAHNTDCMNLAEPFTENHKWSLHQLNRYIQITTGESYTTVNYDSLDSQLDEVMKLMQKIPEDKSVVLKLFLASGWYKHHSQVIEFLKEQNFKFIVIKRMNKLDHYLSLLISVTTRQWNNFSTGYYNDKITIPENSLSAANWFYHRLKQYDEALSVLGMSDCPVVRYEHADEDLSTILRQEIVHHTRGKKMSELPSSERIINFNEVQDHWNSLESAPPEKIYYD